MLLKRLLLPPDISPTWAGRPSSNGRKFSSSSFCCSFLPQIRLAMIMSPTTIASPTIPPMTPPIMAFVAPDMPEPVCSLASARVAVEVETGTWDVEETTSVTALPSTVRICVTRMMEGEWLVLTVTDADVSSLVTLGELLVFVSLVMVLVLEDDVTDGVVSVMLSVGVIEGVGVGVGVGVVTLSSDVVGVVVGVVDVVGVVTEGVTDGVVSEGVVGVVSGVVEGVVFTVPLSSCRWMRLLIRSSNHPACATEETARTASRLV